MDRHIPMDDFVVLDRDEELILALHMAAVEIEEIDEHWFRFEFLGVLLDEDRVLRKRMILEEIIQLERAFRAEEVEDKRSGCVPEGEKEWDKRVADEPILAIFLGEL